jgi:hypothetical protein
MGIDSPVWLVQNPAREIYIISDLVFRATYRLDQ